MLKTVLTNGFEQRLDNKKLILGSRQSLENELNQVLIRSSIPECKSDGAAGNTINHYAVDI